MIDVLFVCTGNIFRSMSAEYCLKQYLTNNKIKGFHVHSAGTQGKQQPMHNTIKKTLATLEIIPKHHIRKVTKSMVQKADLVIAMAKNHQDYILEKFGFDVPLYEEVVHQKHHSIRDIDATMNTLTKNKHMRKIIHYIHHNTPTLYNYIDESQLLFTHFLNGSKKSHRHGKPYLPLHQTKHSVAFMSISIPENQDSHILVIPKKRYANFEEVPETITKDLFKTVQLMGKVLMQTHQGYNVLLNNGRCAGQFIFHTHFHVIPRTPKDNIKIEIWKDKKIKPKEFDKLQQNYKKRIQGLLKYKK